MIVVRQIGLAILAVAAVGVFFGLAPESADSGSTLFAPDYREMVSAAISDSEANNLRAEGAPQQQVVNGWAARDLLSIIALEQNDLIEAAQTAQAEPDERPAALLVIVVLAISLWGATSIAAKSSPVPVTTRPVEPDDAQSQLGDTEAESSEG